MTQSPDSLGVCRTCGCSVADTTHCPACLLRMALGPDERAPASFEPGRRRLIGDYELIRQLGAGGMGVVYEAQGVTDQRRVAIKLIRDFDLAAPTALRRFIIEAEAVVRLNHPNIVAIHEVGEHDGQPFIVMELVEGENLNQRAHQIQEGRAQGEVARLMAKVARAVHHAHSRGVLHRDIKPANILIDSLGEPRLTDFGLAKIAALSPGHTEVPTLTASADAPGTPCYMSPEQVLGGAVNMASDIYGLGAVLYALLAGRPPFQGTTPLDLFKQIAEQRPGRPQPNHGRVHRDLETICLKCLEKDPRYRYGSALSLAEDLDAFGAGQAVMARPPGIMRQAQDWTRRNPLGAALIAILCAGLSVSLALLNVVNNQRREIELDRDQAFDDSMQRVSQIWSDPGTASVTISGRELAILAGRSPAPVRDARNQLVLGVSADDGPSSMAQRYAQLLGGFQDALSGELRERTVFHLRLFKRFNANDEALVRGEAHFIVLSAVQFLRAQTRAPEVTAVALADTLREGVIFAATSSGVRSLSGLRERSIAFPDPDLSISVLARARIVAAGMDAADLGFFTNIIDGASQAGPAVVSSSETIALVLNGEFDAGVTHRGQFERHKHRGLVMLDCFPEAPDVLAARAGTNARLVSALRDALSTGAVTASWPDNRFVGLPGANDGSATNTPVLANLCAAMRIAARFEAGR